MKLNYILCISGVLPHLTITVVWKKACTLDELALSLAGITFLNFKWWTLLHFGVV
jgi:hypothetical protein